MLIDEAVARLAGRLPGLDVRIGDVPGGPGWVSCAEVIGAQAQGEDPTAGWREVLETSYAAQYAIEPPRQVAAMFVLMWYVGVPARIAAASSAVAGVAPDVSPARIAFRLHPGQHYPVEAVVAPGPLLPAAEAHAVAEEHCRSFVDTYPSAVKLGTRQRYGAIADEFRAALRSCADAPYLNDAAEAFGVDPADPREACCFLYALPGTSVCSNCPRAPG